MKRLCRGLLDRVDKNRVAREFPSLDRLGDSHQVLVDHAARTKREMTDFGIAHHTRRQADRFSRRVELRMRGGRVEPIYRRSLRVQDCVRGAPRADTPSVENHQRRNRWPRTRHFFPPLNTASPRYFACAPSSPAILTSRLYLAVRSPRLIDPVLI